ncbi:MAG: flavin reductase family protein, partial [Sciscionella sp.]
FSTVRHQAPKYVFFSAGSGITPLMSMTRALYESTAPTDVVFVHSARTPADIIFREELDTIGERIDMSVVVICEGDSPGERWNRARGRLSSSLLRTIVPDLADREVFTCGPPAYMESVRALLDAEGIDRARRHEESFRLGAPTRAAEETEPTGRRFRVEFRRSQRVVEYDGATTLLEGALGAGLALPSSCGEGVCGTCKLTLLSGRVDMRHAGGIRPREIAQNKILICCSKPLDDVVIDA